jgi:hypothetical protein
MLDISADEQNIKLPSAYIIEFLPGEDPAALTDTPLWLPLEL